MQNFPRKTKSNKPSIISLALVLLSSASKVYFTSSSKATDLIIRACFVPSEIISNFSSGVISSVPFNQRKVLGSLDTSHSNLASSFSKTFTSLSGVIKIRGSSEIKKRALSNQFIQCLLTLDLFSCPEIHVEILAKCKTVPFTFRLAALLALAAWKDTSPVISSLQL